MRGSWSWCGMGFGGADDPLIVDSLKVVDHVLKIETPYGPAGGGTTMMDMGRGRTAVPYDGLGSGAGVASAGGRAGAL